ncbi:glycosyltransferase family protein [Sediminibacterium soli]|uniref:glycosyltransferase family 2 protein n=1 Tax=Sediminibacterium soli TaxID=2698829 RepID=UPI00137A5695|nr:glycosyltransferase family 2 protein [Sediminibacterium soli]NCI45450.1 glycosyltransferase family 2 protein [Sediminibacterium soli]
MKVTGFSFIKNAIKFDYPIVEAIRSILPLCDEIVVAAGDSADETRALVSSIDPKIRIIDTVWSPALREGGAVLADETNKALHAIEGKPDWCFYIQGDEVLHEQYIPVVKEAMLRWKDNAEVDGLLFRYKHFYGSFDYTASSSKWYRNEIRILRHDPSIYSYRDAQGFRKGNDEKLRVKAVDAYIYHYGWVRPPKIMMDKKRNFGNYWGGDQVDEAFLTAHSGDFDYSQIDSLEKFPGTHPEVMRERIQRMNWQFDYDLSYNKFSLKDRFKDLMEKWTGNRPFDYKNYILLR